MTQNDLQIPKKGIIFWPVSTGDSSTIFVNSNVAVQIDIHHMAQSEDEQEESHPVVDHLIDALPEVDGTPYLSTFILTHPDGDHVKGFPYLLEEVEIGELWFSPRIFKEDDDDLHEDAIAFRDEAERRIKTVIESNGEVSSGDRVRIIGYDGILEEELFNDFPEDLISYPGESISEIDGEDVSSDFSSFIHSPFLGTDDEDRNDTSLGMQVILTNDDHQTKILLFGDLKYEGIRKIIDITKENGNEETLEWNILLAPHHCSKSVMYTKDDKDQNVLQRDIMDDLESLALDPGYIVASSKPIPGKNAKGDNPPHALAKSRYEEIVPTSFICTHENPKDSTNPVVFETTDSNLNSHNSEDSTGDVSKASLASVIEEARGESKPPEQTAGFGKC